MRTISPESARVVLLGGVDPTTGGVVTGGSSSASVPVSVSERQYSTAAESIAVADGVVGSIAAGGKMTLQNCGAAAVYVKRGAGASSSSFNWVLSACTAPDDGLGGSCEIADWIGQVSIDGVATPRVAVTLFS